MSQRTPSEAQQLDPVAGERRARMVERREAPMEVDGYGQQAQARDTAISPAVFKNCS